MIHFHLTWFPGNKKNDWAYAERLLRGYHRFCRYYGFQGGLTLLGEELLSWPRLPDLIRFSRSLAIHPIRLDGCATALTPAKALMLARTGVTNVRVTIDGSARWHDHYHGLGSYSSSWDALRLLREVGITTEVLSNVTVDNYTCLPDIAATCADWRVDHYDFQRPGPLSQSNLMAPSAYRQLLIRMDQVYHEMVECQTVFGRSDHLWKLLYYETGRSSSLADDQWVYCGCAAGHHRFYLDESTLYPCRYLPFPLAQWPQNDLIHVFRHHPTMMALRQPASFTGCRGCPLLNYCRGCPARSYAFDGQWQERDPQCWRMEQN
ncbi:radical SAM protein with 4Fe4S-binding SPASM domain [Heliophilum fasciatum]|uniref:Radical SAM protein with 4Fe4S-binding SPASM domain n=2 Tax=Heliophilum fasciatum TaxID=35700 RepID=A0A4V2SW60_9FIRM|nr:hypothetical protein [Heliophilum fasciatum]MCW2279168.1 radical SAM protein with 4Fe4S-binding SPASM domain [Heliophilum fasciatum]TCP61026.1 radical SAM protein with 4Fe4S-binding SPASM domain [Heliophilum fasciatum]